MRKILLFTAALIVSICAAQASELTVMSGINGSHYVPVYASYSDVGFRTQFIYPSSYLESMEDSTIRRVKFYADETNFSFHGARVAVKLAEVNPERFENATCLEPEFTQVYEGTLEVSDKKLIFNFTTPYVYHGGNLLFDISLTSPSESSISDECSFTGYTDTQFFTTMKSSLYRYGNNLQDGSLGNFLPRVTFTYEAFVCPEVTEVTLGEQTDNSIVVNWNVTEPTTTWDLRYSTDYGTTWTTASSAIKGQAYTLSELPSNTEFIIAVKPHCGDDDTWVAANEIASTCVPATPLGWTEGFEDFITGSYLFTGLTCWDELGIAHEEGAYPKAYVAEESDYVHSGNKSLYFVSHTTESAYAILPEFSGSYSELKISFWHKEQFWFNCGYLYFGYFTDITDEDNFTELFEKQPVTNTWRLDSASLKTVPEGARLAFKYGPDGENGWVMAIDDISISHITPASITTAPVAKQDLVYNTAEQSLISAGEAEGGKMYYSLDNDTWKTTIPTATRAGTYTVYYKVIGDVFHEDYTPESNTVQVTIAKPVAPKDLTVTNITTSSATVSWDTDGSATSFWHGYAEGTEQPSIWINRVGKTEDLSSLKENTTYTFYVYYIYDDEQSEVAQISFHTKCEPISELPWNDGFEDYKIGSATSEAPYCWEQIGVNEGYPIAYVADEHYSYKRTGKNAMYIETNNTKDGYLILPKFAAPLNTLRMSFWHYDLTTLGVVLSLGYITDIADSTTFVSVEQFTPSSTVYWKEEKVNLDGIPSEVASTARLAFKLGKSNYTFPEPSGIDDISISEIPLCESPTNLAVQAGNGSADVTWTNDKAKWQLRYKATDAKDWTLVDDITSLTYAITGLTNGTEYEVQVLAYCDETHLSDWTESVRFTPSAATALDHIDTNEKAVKMIDNNRLIIIRNGVKYNAQGALIK